MTIESEIQRRREIEVLKRGIFDLYEHQSAEDQQTLKDLVTRLESERWIPVTQPPDTGRYVFVLMGNGVTLQGRYNGTTWIFTMINGAVVRVEESGWFPKAWRELPKL